MATETPVVVYDANILFPFHVSHILTFAASYRLVIAKWTKAIQQEWLSNIADQRPEQFEGCARRCAAMNASLPDALVSGYEHLIDGIDFHDPKDRHVIAAALHAKAIGIVTRDSDFTAATLAPFGLRAIDPDALLSDCFQRFPRDCILTVDAARRSLTRSAPTPDEYFAILESAGLAQFVQNLRARSSAP